MIYLLTVIGLISGGSSTVLYLRGPEDDLTIVETCSPRFVYMYIINKTVVLG